MGTIVSTVGSGKTYVTLAAWATARLAGGISSANIEQADCYAGSDLGALTLGDTWTAQSTLIQGVVGNRHNGTNTTTTGVAFLSTTIQTFDVPKDVTIQYLRFGRMVNIQNTTDVTLTYRIVGNMFVGTGNVATVSPAPIYVVADASEGTGVPHMTAYVVNNIIYANWTIGTGPVDGIFFSTLTDGSTVPLLNLYCVNNSVLVNTTKMDGATAIEFAYDSLSLGSVVAYNNAVQSNGHADTPFSFVNDAALDITCDDENNITDGAGAAGWGQNGSGSISDAGPIFSSATNARLFLGSGALNAGTSAASTYGASPDAIGTTRPQGAAWDMGALEFPFAAASGGGGGGFWPHWFYK